MKRFAVALLLACVVSVAIAEEKTWRPRLPRYFGGVVTDVQRQQIYAVQRKHRPAIVKAEQALAKAKAAELAEIGRLLSAEQRAFINSKYRK